jgi:hypothetical protein
MLVLDHRFRRVLRAVWLMGLASMLPIHVSAQTVPVPQPPDERIVSSRRPFRGLFHVGARPPGREQSLILTASAYGGYDDNVIFDQPGGSIEPGRQIGGGIVGTEGGLRYTKNDGRLFFNANLDGGVRYVPNRSSLTAASYGAGAGLSYQLTRRTTFHVAQNVEFEPFYQFAPFAAFPDESLGTEMPSNLDFTVLKRSSVLLGTEADLEQQLSRRSTVTLSYDFFDQRFAHGATPGEVTDVRSQGGSIRFHRSLSRYLGFHLGYEYRHFRYPFAAGQTAQNFDGHNIDAGVDYTRTLAFSRQTAFSFSTGSTIFKISGQTFYEATGRADLAHRFDRRGNWQGRVAYNRDVTFIPGFRTPFFADAVTAELQAILGRRLQISATGGYLKGQLGLVTYSPDVTTGTAGITTTYALTDYLGVIADYNYYNYNFASAALLPAGFRPYLNRNSARVGLNLRLPLLQSPIQTQPQGTRP